MAGRMSPCLTGRVRPVCLYGSCHYGDATRAHQKRAAGLCNKWRACAGFAG